MPAATQPAGEVDRTLIGLAWEALAALEIGDTTGARDAIERLADQSDGELQQIATEAARSLAAAEVHDSEHHLQRFLGVADVRLANDVVHLQLALFAARIGRYQSIDEHLDHIEALPVVHDAALEEAINGVRAAAEAEAWRDAEGRLSDLYGTALDEAAGAAACASARRHRGDEVRIHLVVDYEWLRHQTGSPAVPAQGLVTQVRAYLWELGIDVAVVRVDAWASPKASSLQALGDAALRSHPATGERDLLVVLTGQRFHGRADGAFSGAARVAVVRHGYADHDQDALIVAHEVGHFLGLTDLDGTFMQSPGFPLAPVWSPCQRAAVGG